MASPVVQSSFRRLVFIGVLIFVFQKLFTMSFFNCHQSYRWRLIKHASFVLVPAVSVSLLYNRKKTSRHFKLHAESNLEPFKVQYLIIGSGPTAYSAMRTIRYLEPSSRVLIATDSKYLPYERYPLNFEAWLSDNFDDGFEFESRFQASNKFLFFQPESFYVSPFDLESSDEFGGQGLLLKHKFTKIEAEKQLAHLENGDSIQYQKCLLALGSESVCLPKKIPISLRTKFLVLDNLDDYFKVKESLSTCSNLAVIGDNLKALEFAACQSSIFKDDVQRKVTLLCSGKFLADYVPVSVIAWLKAEVEKTGIKIIENVSIEDTIISNNGGKVQMKIANDAVLNCDNVISMLPRRAKTELASNSSLEVDASNGGHIIADSTLKVRSNLYAAGSCVSVFHPLLKSRVSFDMPDHSVMSGRFAALNMLGKIMPYFKLPRLVADFGDDLGFDGIGFIDPKLETQVYFVHKSRSENTFQTSPEKITTEVSSVSEGTEPTDQSVTFSTPEAESNIDIKNAVENECGHQVSKPSQDSSSDNSIKQDSCSSRSPDSIGQDPLQSCAVVYIKNGFVVGVATIGAFGRMFVAENMISHRVKAEDVHEYIPLLLSTKFSLKKPNEEDDDNMF